MAWTDVPAGSCIEAWFDRLKPLGADVEHIKSGWYRVWCPNGVEFHTIQVSVDVDDDCTSVAARLKSMASLKGLL